MGASTDIGAHYAASRQRLEALLIDRQDDVASIEVPACPGWTVHSVVAHLVGVIEDAAAGRIRGIPAPEQTAEHLLRHQDETLVTMLHQWRVTSPIFERALSDRQVWPALLDALTHEHDVRSAIGDAGSRDCDSIRLAARHLADTLDPDLGVMVRFTEEPEFSTGFSAPLFALTTTAFEFFRLRLGRRSTAQVELLDWSRSPRPVIDQLFVFAPRPTPLEE